MATEIFPKFSAGRPNVGRWLVNIFGLIMVGLLAWMLSKGQREPEAEKAHTTLQGKKNLTTGVPAQTVPKTPLSSEKGTGIEVEALRRTIADLKAKADYLPTSGAMPTAAQRKEMLLLTREVKQPNWPGRNNTISWIEQGMVPGGPYLPGTEDGEKERRQHYANAVSIIAQMELTKLLNDPHTRFLAARYIRAMSDYFNQKLTEEPSAAQQWLNDVERLPGGPDTPITILPSDFVQAIGNYGASNSPDGMESKIRELALPEFVKEFIEDRIRAHIFESALADTTNKP